MNLMGVSLSIRNTANELKASIILFFTDLFYGFGFVFTLHLVPWLLILFSLIFLFIIVYGFMSMRSVRR